MYYTYNQNGDRFVVPFLLGGLTGSALVGLSRPRPVFVQGAPNYYPAPMPYPRPLPPYPGYFYNNTTYGYRK